jgi:nitrite reductase/ring-hydroxylating ferredoxin subunit
MSKIQPERDCVHACSGCTQSGTRRAFLRTAAGTAAGLLYSIGATSADAMALTIGTIRGTREKTGDVSYPIPASDGATIDRNHEVILVRWESAVYAFALSCPHQRTMLKWLPRDQRFQCPKHKSKYKPSGNFISGRATRGMDRYPVRIQNNQVFVNTSRAIHEDDEPAAWAAATARL